MTTFHDVPTNLLLPLLAERMEAHDSISRPEWALHVKTGVHRERPPTQDNWW
nr:40S ribosomal protein S19 [Euryarchaeota archaeon]